MKSILIAALLLGCTSLYAQKAPATDSADGKFYSKGGANRALNIDAGVTTSHQVTIKGQVVPYKVTAGTLPVWDEDGKAIAALEYTYYERTDITNKSTRPLIISFNGGPGSASVWMHIAYTGPRILEIDSEGYPIQPYGIKENPYSVLDVADIVFVNPVNTGYSRILIKDTPKEKFFGVNADIKYLAEWLNNFVTRKSRWTSPKYIIGESYGTTRVSGLALELQNTHWMYLNGVILVSPTELGRMSHHQPRGSCSCRASSLAGRSLTTRRTITAGRSMAATFSTRQMQPFSAVRSGSWRSPTTRS